MKLLKKLFVLVLALGLLMTMMAPASASWSTEYSAGDQLSYCVGELKRSVPYCGAGGQVIICNVYGLSVAQKITALADGIYPVHQLEYELGNLEKHMNADFVRYEQIYSGHKALNDYLSAESRAKLNKQDFTDAVELLTAVKELPEYESDANVKYIVSAYLGTALFGSQLRWGLSVLTDSGYAGGVSEDIAEMDVYELMQAAHEAIDTEEFQALMVPLGKIKSGNVDAYALNRRYEPEEMEEIWDAFSEAASVYWPGQVAQLNSMRLTIPVEVYSSLEAWVGSSYDK